MTWEHYTNNWRELKTSLKRESGKEILAPPATVMLKDIKTRVFEHGVTTDGEQMQEYSTKPWTYTRARFKNKSAFRANAGAKGMFLPSGYRELRDIQGMETSFINLDYFGKFKGSYQMRTSGNKVVFSLGSGRSTRLRREHEDRFGPILSGTQDEVQNFSNVVVSFVDRKVVATLTK